MVGANSTCCSFEADRLPNDELVALMRDVVERSAPPPWQLQQAAASVFLAFYRGQASAQRASEADLPSLVREAQAALYRHRGTFNPDVPFRAWLLEIARLTLIDHLERRAGDPTRHNQHTSGQSTEPLLAKDRERRPAVVS